MTIIDRRYSVAEGTAIKAPCRAATTAHITLSGEQTIDDVAVVEGDRVLVKSQSTGSENGIYSCSTGNWTRTRDFDGAYDVVTGTRIFVTAGTDNGNTEWCVTTTGDIVIDSTNLAFAAIGGLGTPFADGTVAAPGASFESAPSWGWYKTADGIGVAVNGVLILEIKPGAFIGTALLDNDAVTLAKLVNASAQSKVLARKSASSGDWEECSLSDILDFVGSAADGDILYRTGGVWTRLPKGIDGQYLAQASSAPSWAAAPGMVLLSTQAASSSSQIDFITGLDNTYDAYEVVVSSAKPATDDVQFQMLIGTGGGPTFQTSGYSWGFSGQSSAGLSSDGSASDTKIGMSFAAASTAAVGNATGENYNATIRFNNPEVADFMEVYAIGAYSRSDSTRTTVLASGRYNTAGIITGLRFKFSSGNIASGRFSLYGLKKS